MSGVSSLVGQSVVGQYASAPWWAGSREVTQGWGPTALTQEPGGHGYAHWHAGADIGLPCGSHLTLPPEITGATLRYVDNPGGYGTAVVVTIGGVDIWFGHLAARLVPAGPLRGGIPFAATNSTGNSTGCHVHIEVRPKDARYGTDVDPSRWILDPVAAAGRAQPQRYPTGSVAAQEAGNTGNPVTDAVLAALSEGFKPVAQSISDAEKQFVSGMVGSAQVGLGGLIMLGGFGAVVAGARGQNFGQASRGAVDAVRTRTGPGKAEFANEKATQGAIARDVAEQAAEARAAGAERAGVRRNTLGAYRAGLISRAEAQRRLGEAVRATGRRPKRVAMGGGFRKPGVYKMKGGTVDVQAARSAAVRASRVKGAKVPTPRPAPPIAPEAIPF